MRGLWHTTSQFFLLKIPFSDKDLGQKDNKKNTAISNMRVWVIVECRVSRLGGRGRGFEVEVEVKKSRSRLKSRGRGFEVEVEVKKSRSRF